MTPRHAGFVAAALLCTGCLALDPNKPPLPRLAGRYVTTISVRYRSHLEARYDTLAAVVTLSDAKARGPFVGAYVTALGDSGVIAGNFFAHGAVEMTTFAEPFLPTLQGATFLHRLYPWCDFLQIGTGTLYGMLQGDSLVIEGRASVSCNYQAWGRVIGVGTDLDVRLAGER